MNNWDDIRYFLEIARAGSVTAAARVLGVNHSTVSRRLRALEDRHGVRLFNHLPNGYELTAAGSAIFDTALALETQNQQISRQLLGQDSRLSGETSITMPHDILEFCLIDDLAAFRRLHPDIVLNLHVAKGLKNLAAREADIAVRLTPAPPEYLMGTKIVGLGQGLYAHKALGLQDIVPVIAWTAEKEIPTWAQSLFRNSEIVLRVDDLHSMYVAVKSGIGVAKMPCCMENFAADKSVVKLPLEAPISSWGLWVLNHKDLRHTARIRVCRKFLAECLEAKRAFFSE